MENILTKLNWRYAVKRYDKAQSVAPQQIEILKEVIQLAPSSFGLQPFKVVFVEDPETREKLKQASFHQSQITDSTVLVVFAVENTVDEPFVDKYFEQLCRVRDQRMEGGLRLHRDNIAAVINRKTAPEMRCWAAQQAYLALGFLLFAAAELGVDANAMEGFIPTAYDEILGLRSLGLSAVVIAAIGVRHPEDFFQRLPKVRKPAEELFIQR